MALKATICKADLTISDLDRGHFAEYQLTLAKHPSETDERLMVRLLAFVLYSHQDLSFGKGLSSEDEPTLVQTEPSGEVTKIIEIGLPEEDRMRKACHRAQTAALVVYGRAVDVWWGQQKTVFARYKNLEIQQLTVEDAKALAALVERNMKFEITIQEGMIYWGGLCFSLKLLQQPQAN